MGTRMWVRVCGVLFALTSVAPARGDEPAAEQTDEAPRGGAVRVVSGLRHFYGYRFITPLAACSGCAPQTFDGALVGTTPAASIEAEMGFMNLGPVRLGFQGGAMIVPSWQLQGPGAAGLVGRPLVMPQIGHLVEIFPLRDAGLRLAVRYGGSWTAIGDRQGRIDDDTRVGGFFYGGAVGYDVRVARQLQVGARLQVDGGVMMRSACKGCTPTAGLEWVAPGVAFAVAYD